MRLDLAPRGHEQGGRRPALILSPRAYNAATRLAIVAPITSRRKGYPFEVALPEEGAVSGVVLADQVRSVDWHARNADIVERADDRLCDAVVARLAALLQVRSSG